MSVGTGSVGELLISMCAIIKIHVCVHLHLCVSNGQQNPYDPCQTLAYFSSLEATGRGLLKVHAIAPAMSKNTSLIGMPDYRRCRLVVS